MSRTKSHQPRLRVPMRVRRKALRMALGSTAGRLKFAAGLSVAMLGCGLWYSYVFALQMEQEGLSAALTAAGGGLAVYLGLVISAKLLSNELKHGVMAQGLCPNCGFDVHGDFSQVCPECDWQPELE